MTEIRVKDDVLIKVDTTIYWLMKEEIANKISPLNVEVFRADRAR